MTWTAPQLACPQNGCCSYLLLQAHLAVETKLQSLRMSWQKTHSQEADLTKTNMLWPQVACNNSNICGQIWSSRLHTDVWFAAKTRLWSCAVWIYSRKQCANPVSNLFPTHNLLVQMLLTCSHATKRVLTANHPMVLG